MRHVSLSALLCLVALGSLQVASPGQSPLFTFYGDASNDWFGYSVSGAGDVNNDGFPDLIVGAYGDDNTGNGSGSVRVLSGINGGVLHTFNGDSNFDTFGWSVSGAGDANNDGYADLIVGAYFDDNSGSNAGSARVFSGKDGSTLYTKDGDSAGDFFGYSVSCAGDVDKDGYDDVIVGACEDDNGTAIASGSAKVFHGNTGALIYNFEADSFSDQFGFSVSDAGDVNGDGYTDLLVGAHRDDNNSKIDSGSARVFSGKDGGIFSTFNGDSAGDLFGTAVSGAGDVNGDGYADLIVGALFDDNNGTNSGMARVFSGFTGITLYSFNGDAPGDFFAFSVSGAGDVNGDGYDDVLVGAQTDDNNGTDSGSARLFSGINGSILYTVDGAVGDHFGVSVSDAGDVNGDGVVDFVVGAYLDGKNGPSAGLAQVISGAVLPLTTDTHEMSVSAASTQNLTIDAGVANALKSYWIFTNFAASGDVPGVTVAPGITIPLNPDPLTNFVIGLTQLGGGAPTFVGWKGTLAPNGKAFASLNTSGPVPVLVGESIRHAALIYTVGGCGIGCDTFQLATNWVPMTTVP